MLKPHMGGAEEVFTLAALRDQCGPEKCEVDDIATSTIEALHFDAGQGGSLVPLRYGRIEVEGEGEIYFRVFWGDEPHQYTPVVSCDPTCEEGSVAFEYDPKGSALGQISVNTAGRYVLISSEYYGENAGLFMFGERKALIELPDSLGAVWLPGIVSANVVVAQTPVSQSPG